MAQYASLLRATALHRAPQPTDPERGASEQAIGITKGGRNSKIHGLVDKLCRPWVLILTPDNTTNCTVGPACVSLLDGMAELARIRATRWLIKAHLPAFGKTAAKPENRYRRRPTLCPSTSLRLYRNTDD